MPYSYRKTEDRSVCPASMPWVVERINPDGSKTPVPGGCHATAQMALRHQRALVVNVDDARR